MAGNYQRWVFYNPDVKEMFIEEKIKNFSSKKAYRIILGNISEQERLFDKNFYEMTIDEARETLDMLNKKTISSVASAKSKLIKYVQWALHGDFEGNKELLSWLKTVEDESLTNRTAMENQYIGIEEYWNIIHFAKNPMDASMVILGFNGAGGYNHSDFTTLTNNDLDFMDNTVHLHGKIKTNNKVENLATERNGRTIQLLKPEMDILYSAMGASEYWVKPINRKGNKKPEWEKRDLVINNNVFRPMDYGKKESDPEADINSQVLMRRLRVLVGKEGYGKPQINFKTLGVSGMLYQLKLSDKSVDQITDEDYTQIVVKYNLRELNYGSLKRLYKFMINKEMAITSSDD